MSTLVGLYNSCDDCEASTGSLVRPPQPSASSLLQETCRRLLIAWGLTICDVQLDDLLSGLMHRGYIQYIPLKTGFVRQMLAPYSSYSAFVWQAWLQKRVDIISYNSDTKKECHNMATSQQYFTFFKRFDKTVVQLTCISR